MLKPLFILVLFGGFFCCLFSAETGMAAGTFRLSERGEKSAEFLADAGMFLHYMKNNDRVKAAEKLQEALERNPFYIPFALIAVEFYETGSLSEEKFIALARKHPESALLCGIVADTLASKGKFQEAEDLLDFAVAYRLEPRKEGEPPAGIKGERNLEELQVMFSSYLAQLFRRKKFEKADQFLEKADRICPMELSESSLLTRIEYYLTAKLENPGNAAYQEACRKYEEQLKKKLDGPNEFCAEVPGTLAALLAADNFELLEALLGEAVLTNPASLAAYRNLGMLYAIRRDSGNALRALSCEIILTRARNRKLSPGKLPVLLRYTIASGNEKNIRERIKLLSGMNLMNDDLYFHAAEFYLGKGRYGQARAFAERIKNETARNIILAMILQREKKYGQALQIYLKLERENPELPDYKMLAAEMANRAGEAETEKQFVNEMILKADKQPEFRNYLGYTWADRGIRLEQAEKYIRSALKDDPHNYAYLDSLAWVLYRKKSFSEAKKVILEAIGRSPDRSSRGVLLDHAGDIFSALGEEEKAREYWQKAVQTDDPELDPDVILKKISPQPSEEEPESQERIPGPDETTEVTSNRNPESAAGDPKNSPAAR